MANTSARLAKVESVMIARCEQAWERMYAATKTVMMWTIEHGTPEQVDALTKWAEQQPMTEAERATFNTIIVPDALDNAAVAAIQAFDHYPDHITGIVVARREALSAQKVAETMADDLAQYDDVVT